MRISDGFLTAAIFFLSSVAGAGQAAVNTPTQTAPKASAGQPGPIPPIAASGLLQPALTTVQQTVTTLRLDKWKRGTVRDETGENINAILRDVQVTLPPLLGAADAAQGPVSSVSPAISTHCMTCCCGSSRQRASRRRRTRSFNCSKP
jgi:hypothetical protein